MPETAPLDLSEATIGYELDSITLRNIASIRYVRHHEWLDHVLGDPLPTSSILPPDVTEPLNEAEIDSRTKQLESEIAELEKEKQEGWNFHVDKTRSNGLSKAIRKLREDFGVGSVENTQKEIENLLGVKISLATAMKSVPVTYDRHAVDQEQARIALEKRSADKENAARETDDNISRAAETEKYGESNAVKSDSIATLGGESSSSMIARPLTNNSSSIPGSTPNNGGMDVDMS